MSAKASLMKTLKAANEALKAGDAASVDAPAKFECDLARGESDFEPVRVSFLLFNLCTGNSTDGVFCFYS